MANKVVTVRRRTAFVLDRRDVADRFSVTRQIVRPSLIRVELYVDPSTTGDGTVTVVGDVNGSPTTEVLSFNGSGVRATEKRFEPNLRDFVTSGLANESPLPQLDAKALGTDGSPQRLLYTVIENWPMHLDQDRQSWPASMPGSVEKGLGVFSFDYTDQWRPREGDYFIDGLGDVWEVEGTPALLGVGRMHHYECDVKRVQDESVKP